MDWAAQRAKYRPMVSAHTTGERLFTILTDMIKPLNDRHTAIAMDKHHLYVGSRAGTRRPSKELRDRVNRVTVEHLKKKGAKKITTTGNDLIRSTTLPGHLGYLQVQAFDGYTKADTFQANSALLTSVLDKLPVRSIRGLIIDMRYNLGGDDPLGLSIASRLTKRPYIAYSKSSYNDSEPSKRFTVPQPITVQPARGPIFTGPVAILTSDLTVSAGETFTQAMMGRTPAPTRIGTNTQGVFSDVMDRRLPNGWMFGLPNEEYLTKLHTTFDGTGIPPDITTPVFTDDELAHGRDTALDRAIELLR